MLLCFLLSKGGVAPLAAGGKISRDVLVAFFEAGIAAMKSDAPRRRRDKHTHTHTHHKSQKATRTCTASESLLPPLSE